VEVIHIKPQILLRTEVYKKCLIGIGATGCITLKLRLKEAVLSKCATALQVVFARVKGKAIPVAYCGGL
jgi:hypothetical protein